MSEKRRYGDPRKEQAYEEARSQGAGAGRSAGRSKRELSVGFIFAAWIVFFVVWLALGSLLVAALVFGVILTGAIAILNWRNEA